MNDHELLLEVIRVIGAPLKYWDGSGHWPTKGFFHINQYGHYPFGDRWDPLHNDGDSRRLQIAEKLTLGYSEEEQVWLVGGFVSTDYELLATHADPNRAVLMAVVARGMGRRRAVMKKASANMSNPSPGLDCDDDEF